MARKTTGNTTKRTKKTADAVPSSDVQVASEVSKSGASITSAPPNVPLNIEEEIRRRAYELYLQRRSTAGAGHGNENQDWLIAEREILSRLESPDHHA